MFIYGMNLRRLCLLIACAVFFWGIAYNWVWKKWNRKRTWLSVNGGLLLLSLYWIVQYTILNRTSLDVHEFTFFAAYTNEFYREMLMNLFLYFPLGLSLPHILRRYGWSIFLAFFLALSIETWQYFASTGLAQGTDVICNTLGVVIGGLSFLIPEHLMRKRQDKYNKK